MSSSRELHSLVWMCLPLTLLLATPAFAEVPDNALSETCHPGRWSLAGAGMTPSDGENGAAFSKEWHPVLDRVAECLRLESSRTACLVVEGRYDERKFSDEVVAAFGSVADAQAARARSRAGRVVAELFGRGVPPSRVRVVPPLDEPSYRGAELTLVANCVARPVARSAPIKKIHEKQQVTVVRSQPRPEVPSIFWLEAGTDLSLTVAPDAVLSPALQIGIGWHVPWVYARLRAGLAAATASEQRTSVEFTGAVGGVPFEWLELGIVAGHRTGSYSPVDPWLEQVWFLGLEATECLFEISDTTQLCLSQTLLPIGQRNRRAEVVGGNIERIQPTRKSIVRFDVGAALRMSL